MKIFSFDRFTGIIAIGSLVVAVVALIIHSFVDIKPFLNNLVSSSVWDVFISIPIIVISYLVGIITVKLSTFAFDKFRKESPDDVIRRIFEIGRIDNKLITNKYETLSQELELLQAASSAVLLLGIAAFLKVMTTSPDIGGTLPYGKVIFGVVAIVLVIGIPSLLFKIISKMYHQEKLERMTREIYAGRDPYDIVQIARHPLRPQTSDYIAGMLDEFVELHGDRRFGDDRAITTGFARIGDRRFLLVGHRKGKETKENIACNWGCAHPEGYRKALHKMKVAEKFGLPIVTLINTPGAYPGVGAEERGQAWAIAENIMVMSRLRTPIICIVIGEGGSGGALGIGVGDRVLMLQYAYYSVISPEGCAAILWKNGERAADAAAALRLTSADLVRFGVVDEVVPEPVGGAHRHPRHGHDHPGACPGGQ